MISLVFCFNLSFKGVKNEFVFSLSHHDSWWLLIYEKVPCCAGRDLRLFSSGSQAVDKCFADVAKS